MAVLSSTRSGTDGPDIPSCSRPGAAHQTPLPRDRYHLRAARRGWRARAPGRVRERPDGHAGPRSLRSTLTVLPSRTSRSFPSRASQPTPSRRSWSGSLVPCLNLLSVVTPCSSRYCQIAPAASPISASMLQRSPLSASAFSSQNPTVAWSPIRLEAVRLDVQLRLLPLEHFAFGIPRRETFPARSVVFLRVATGAHSGAPQLCPNSSISFSVCSSQYVMSISRYIVAAVVRCSCACSRLPVRR